MIDPIKKIIRLLDTLKVAGLNVHFSTDRIADVDMHILWPIRRPWRRPK